MKRIFFILIFFLFSCKPSTQNKMISGVVVYANEEYIGIRLEKYEFTQTNIRDSLYTLTYSRRITNLLDTTQKVFHNYIFNLVPGNPQAKQEMQFNNMSSPLLLLGSQTYHIMDNDYTVYKYASNIYAYDFCITANIQFWSPEFGIVIWNLASGFMHTGGNTSLVNPVSQKDSILVSVILDSIYHDQDFLTYPHLFDKSTIDICNSNMPPVDQPEKIVALRKYVERTLNYPEAAQKACVSGEAFVNLKIDTAGNIVNKNILISDSQFLVLTDTFENECWRVVESISNLEPMTFMGKKVPTYISLPFTFKLPDPEKCEEVLTKREEERIRRTLDEVYIMTQKEPEFPGGAQALQQYIANELKYPIQARKDKITGTVYLNFFIDKDGGIGEITVKEVLADDYQDLFLAEAIRVVRNMPKWTPGEIREGPVKVKYMLPIRFELE